MTRFRKGDVVVWHNRTDWGLAIVFKTPKNEKDYLLMVNEEPTIGGTMYWRLIFGEQSQLTKVGRL